MMARGLLYASLAYLGWGLLGPLGKLLLDGIPPLGLNALRMSLSTLVVLPFWYRYAPRAIRSLRDPWLFATLILGTGICFTLYIYSIENLDPAYATLGFYTAPIWTILLSKPMLGERIGPGLLGVVVISSAAGAYVILGGSASLEYSNFGFGLSVLSGFTWGLYAVLLRKHARDLPIQELALAGFFVGTAYFLLFAYLFEGGIPTVPTQGLDVLWMAMYVLFPSVLSMVLFSRALQLYEANGVNALVGIEVVATLIWSALLIQSSYSMLQWVAVLILILVVGRYLYTQGKQSSATLPSSDC